MSGVLYYDGDFTVAEACGPKLYESPFSEISDKLIYHQRFMQRLDSFVATPLGTRDPDDRKFYLVKEGDHKEEGGGIVSWERRYSQIPSTRVRTLNTAHTYQWIANSQIGEVTLSITATETLTYHLILGSVIKTSLKKKKVIIQAGSAIQFTGDDFLLVEDESLEQWEGPIYVKRTLKAPLKSELVIGIEI